MTHMFVPQASMTRPIAKALNVPYALANRMVGVYNKFLYLDHPVRVKVGIRDSQISVGTSYPIIAHLKDFIGDSKLGPYATWILAAAGYVRASGVDAIASDMLSMKVPKEEVEEELE